MGIILGRFRKKKTTMDVLESLDKEIKNIEEFRRNTEQAHRRIVGRFVIVSVGIYLASALIFYFSYFPANFYDQLFYMIPLILAPVTILVVKRILTWYYQRKIASKQNKLVTLKNEKKQILEKVMETETYKIAKTILDKFAPPEQNRVQITTTPIRPIPQVPITTGLRQRAISPTQQILPTPIRPFSVAQAATTTKSALQNVPVKHLPSLGRQLPMPRPILPKERTFFDKMVDYLVGDGPSNRYALICKNCFGHNGMAFRDEVDYFSFRCCYCYTFNPALKKRPAAPKFDKQLQPVSDQHSQTDSEKNSQTDSDTGSDDGVVVIKSAEEIANSHKKQSIEIEEQAVNIVSTDVDANSSNIDAESTDIGIESPHVTSELAKVDTVNVDTKSEVATNEELEDTKKDVALKEVSNSEIKD
ncbi:hypothetical protein FQA39_LY04696 [Lamprigera yunnana]|nr:hypothetical protein FQA39_LY04696 [Lamprigera yunnana]